MDWFRVYVDMLYDRKLRRLPAEQRWLWIAVLGVARSANASGKLLLSEGIVANVEDLSDIAAISVEHAEHGLARFQDQGMLHEEDGVYVVTHWNQRQYEYVSWSPEARRAQKQAERLAQKQAESNGVANMSQENSNSPARVRQKAEDRYTEKAAATRATGDALPPRLAAAAILKKEGNTDGDIDAAFAHLESRGHAALDGPTRRLVGICRKVIAEDIHGNGRSSSSSGGWDVAPVYTEHPEEAKSKAIIAEMKARERGAEERRRQAQSND